MSLRAVQQSIWKAAARRVALAAHNALELVLVGRLSEPYRANHEVLHRDPRYSLRRYGCATSRLPSTAGPLLLVPPLMLTAEIYDISEELSASAMLVGQGVDVWVVDFRAPENEEGGLARTLDDHVLAVGDAIDRVRDATGRDVHVAGYSQGGMFAYQSASYRRAVGIASVITMGSPVDIHRSVPHVRDVVVKPAVASIRWALKAPLARIQGLPGGVTSLAFKVMGLRREVQQIVGFFRSLDDRKALEKREAKRLFLRGDGFVAWPGPALRTFVDEFVVANRMLRGGFTIAGQTCSLDQIDCPILCFVGSRDAVAAPAAVRAIHRAAPNANISEVSVESGHFGLVVGSESLRRTWPAVVQWIRWQDSASEANPETPAIFR